MVRRLEQVVIVWLWLLMVTGLNSFGATVQLPPADQATSCEMSDMISFRCGIAHIGPAWASGPNLGESLVQKSAIEFPLAGLVDVVRAEVWLNGNGPCAYPECQESPPALEFHGYRGNGTIEIMDLNVSNLVLRTQPLTDPFGSYRLDVTEYVSGLVREGASFVGFAVRDVTPQSFFSSTENYLYVEASVVPEPTTASILVLIVGSAGRCRR